MTLKYPMQQQFTPEEVEAILHTAVRRSLEQSQSTPDKRVTRERLELMASELGIEEALLESILNERTIGQMAQIEQQAQEQQRALFIARRRTEFLQHLIPYLIISGMLLWLNQRVSPNFLWALFPTLGWGIGLAIHATEALPSRGPLFEDKFEKWQRKQRKRAKKAR